MVLDTLRISMSNLEQDMIRFVVMPFTLMYPRSPYIFKTITVTNVNLILMWTLFITHSMAENFMRRLHPLNTIWLRLVRNDCGWTSNMSACQSSCGQGHAYVSKPCLTFSRLEIIRGFCAHTQYFQRTIAGDQHWTKDRDILQLNSNSDFN